MWMSRPSRLCVNALRRYASTMTATSRVSNIPIIQGTSNDSFIQKLSEPLTGDTHQDFNRWMDQPLKDRLFIGKFMGYTSVQTSLECGTQKMIGNGYLCQRGNSKNALYFSFHTRFKETNDGSREILYLEFEISPHKTYDKGRATLVKHEYGHTRFNWVESSRVLNMLEWDCKKHVFMRILLLVSGCSGSKNDYSSMMDFMS
ncbi:hypothetical protein AKO1_007745 [Acrasis kona]|uniref:Uncharacterized protein n=1 Tax=Acrasis kona TaxID=1008807 RepID=A0AAW2YQB0_9EUKA